jgi:hypothetical protein
MPRWLFAAWVAAILVAFSDPGRQAVAGTIPCREMYGSGGGYVCGADVEARIMDPAFVPAQTQAGAWATSMAMLIAFNGGGVSQADILSAIFGATLPDSLPPAQAQTYLNHSYTASADHSVSTTTGTALFTTPQNGSRSALRTLVGQLQNETPLLVFTSHNAMILTTIYYHADLFSRPVSLYAAVVRDPYPVQGTAPPPLGVKLDNRPGERFLSAAEFNDIQYVDQLTVASH